MIDYKITHQNSNLSAIQLVLLDLQIHPNAQTTPLINIAALG